MAGRLCQIEMKTNLDGQIAIAPCSAGRRDHRAPAPITVAMVARLGQGNHVVFCECDEHLHLVVIVLALGDA